MAENKGGCLTWIIILFVLGTILGAVEDCSHKHHKRQDLIIPEYTSFKNWSGDPKITFQTFGDNRKDLACLNYEWNSGQMAEMYVVIENGNDLYDGTDSFVGYIVVRKDGSFDIKGSKTASGHYVGLDGAKMSYRGKKEATSKAKKKKDKAYGDEDEGDTLDWLDGIWMATNTPVGDATLIIKGNSITETIDGVTHKGRFTIGEDYLQVRYDEGLGVRLDLDRDNNRIGLGEDWWLSKERNNTSKKEGKEIKSAPAVSPLDAAGENRVYDVNISVVLKDDGCAQIREVWDMTLSRGTEVYLGRENLGDIKILDLTVSDETGETYQTDSTWDTDRSLDKKKSHCGLNPISGGYEICWGIGKYGHRCYTVNYTLTNLVKSLDDYDMIHYMFYTPSDFRAEHVKVTLEKPGFEMDTLTRIWGFGYDGYIWREDGKVIAESETQLGPNHFVTVLMRFDKGAFSSQSIQSRPFSAVLERALESAQEE